MTQETWGWLFGQARANKGVSHVAFTGPIPAPPVSGLALCAEMIKHWEGCVLHPYHGRADRPDIWTIGWGATTINGVVVGPNTPPLSQAQADALLFSDITSLFSSILSLLPGVPLNPNQQAALVCFVYNIGLGAFASSTIRKDLLNHDFSDASAQFPLWDHSNGKVFPALSARRKVEQMVFNGAPFSTSIV